MIRILVLRGQSFPDLASVSSSLSLMVMLEKLDASRCNIRRLPTTGVWNLLTSLKILYLHENHIQHWDEVVPLADSKAPIKWMTMFDNPVMEGPTARAKCLALGNFAYTLLALDRFVITPQERLGDKWNSSAAGDSNSKTSCFGSCSAQAYLPWPLTASAESTTAASLAFDVTGHKGFTELQRMRYHLSQLKKLSLSCNAALCIQRHWRGARTRLATAPQESKASAAMKIQKVRHFDLHASAHTTPRPEHKQNKRLEFLRHSTSR
eukprot:GHVT01038151.1.p1 GENE.GHVT01038151.1~~GHVT01038151.1.p1  ORF type:complete len:265 (+),score=15.23 GHVT01038151.1:454-1248(+)